MSMLLTCGLSVLWGEQESNVRPHPHQLSNLIEATRVVAIEPMAALRE